MLQTLLEPNFIYEDRYNSIRPKAFLVFQIIFDTTKPNFQMF